MRLFLSRDIPRCDLAHPYLSVTGMLNAYGGDGLGLHAGAVVIDGRAWVIVAAKGGGKTTSLALLDRAGHPVLADDLSVVGPQLQVHRGPRFLDLRREVAERLAIGEDRGFIGMRRRWRYRIRDAPLTAPLGGVVVPVWVIPSSTRSRAPGVSRRSLPACRFACRVVGKPCCWRWRHRCR